MRNYHVRQVKLNCNQILGHVADQNYIVIIDSIQRINVPLHHWKYPRFLAIVNLQAEFSEIPTGESAGWQYNLYNYDLSHLIFHTALLTYCVSLREYHWLSCEERNSMEKISGTWEPIHFPHRKEVTSYALFIFLGVHSGCFSSQIFLGNFEYLSYINCISCKHCISYHSMCYHLYCKCHNANSNHQP